MQRALVNGVRVIDPEHAISVEERGLAYGDGLFETMLLKNGIVRLIEDHLARLHSGCGRLGIAPPNVATLSNDIATLTAGCSDGIVKLLVTRGAGGRGYHAPAEIAPTRIAILYPPLAQEEGRETVVRWCTTRLARNAQLAGIKHLNRLEHVLARNEWNDPQIADGLLLDTEEEVIESITSNVFAVIDGVLATPDLRFCGVRGVMRQRVLAIATRLNIEIGEGAIRKDELLRASEVFLTNALRGIRPVRRLDGQEWGIGRVTQRLMDTLRLDA